MALRIVRAATGRSKVLKFTGHFHGWHDFVMPGAYQPYDGSAPAGVPEVVNSATVVVDPNDPALVEAALKADPDIGAVIVEPTGGHWGVVPVRGPFLHALRELCDKYDRVFIMDEVITGFRVSPGGAQSHYGVKPDLTTMAKILAGGLPGGAVGGKASLLNHIEFRPGKPKIRHPGTYNGNPLSAAAGISALRRVATGEPTRQANEASAKLKNDLNAMFARRDFSWVCYGDFSLLHLLPDYDGPRPDHPDFIPYGGAVHKLDGPKNPKRTHAFRQAMLLNGVDLPGLGMFLTACHTDTDIQLTVGAIERSIDMLRADGLDG
jgi:glutamate-1-semialdehyde 2,1-aminomutase